MPVTKCSRERERERERELELAMSAKEQATETPEEELLKIFEGVKGPRPDSEQELKDWLASPEGHSRRFCSRPATSDLPPTSDLSPHLR